VSPEAFAAIANQHVAQICDDFLTRGLHAECSCSWVGPQAKNWHEAQADHAAHVHVVMGLATDE